MTIRLGLVVLAATLAAAVPAVATFSGADGRISFAKETADGMEIFSANPDGTDQQQLTAYGPDAIAQFSDWSPDGSKIAYDSDDGGFVQVYTMNADGSGKTALTSGPGHHSDPAYHPTADILAIESDWDDYPAAQGIWLISSTTPGDRGDALQVTGGAGKHEFDGEPQFTPDGGWIVFTRYSTCPGAKEFELKGCRSAIHRVRADGTGLRRLTEWGDDVSAPDVSPDGKWIVYDTGDAFERGANGEIHVMRLDGSGQRRLTKNAAPTKGTEHRVFDQNPVFSPSGERIMFSRFGLESVDLYSMDADGSDVTRVTDGGFHNKVDWGVHP